MGVLQYSNANSEKGRVVNDGSSVIGYSLTVFDHSIIWICPLLVLEVRDGCFIFIVFCIEISVSKQY